MSPSARRLSSAVTTDRFAWQGHEPTRAVAVMRAATAAGGHTVAPALRDLPAPNADRTEAIEREAYARGLADGRRAAEGAIDERFESISRQLGIAVADLAAVRGILMRRTERDLVRLAVAMAERVLRRTVDCDRELLVVMARVAIDRLGEQAMATIHLNPADHEVVAAQHKAEPGASVDLVADPAVPRGGCLVRSSFGTIDTSIESQVRELSRALIGDDDGESPAEGPDGAPAAS